MHNVVAARLCPPVFVPLCVVLLLAHRALAADAADAPSLRFELSSDKAEVAPLEPFTLSAALQNRGPRAVTIENPWLDIGQGSSELYVRRDRAAFQRVERGGADVLPRKQPLAAGGAVRRRLGMSFARYQGEAKQLIFMGPGRYELLWLHRYDEQLPPVVSNVVAVRVSPLAKPDYAVRDAVIDVMRRVYDRSTSPAEAGAALRQLAAAHADSAYAHVLKQYAQQMEATAAAEAADAAARRAPQAAPVEDPEERAFRLKAVVEARAALAAGNLEQADRIAKELLLRAGNYGDVHVIVGDLWLRRGDRAKARESYSFAAQLLDGPAREEVERKLDLLYR